MTSKTVCVFTLPAPSSPSDDGTKFQFLLLREYKVSELSSYACRYVERYTQCDSEPSGPTRCAIGSLLLARRGPH